ncbi:MAG: AfsR family transcriptional regulator, partial [Acidimicrobiia bacterium]|nr:AfsR family transcriptional regulator [Acidimicrobiia bacterium]
MQVSILGPVEACVGGGPAPLRRGRQQLLLAALALHPRVVVPLHQLVGTLWPGELPVDPENALHQLVSQLRRALRPADGAIATAAGGYRLDVEDDAVDARCFERELGEARAALAEERWSAAAAAASRALGLWRGPAIGGVAEGALASHAIALEGRRALAELVLADARLAIGQPETVVTQLGPIVAEQPHDEELWSRFLTALARTGRPAEALHRYEDLCARLAEDLGVTPGPVLRDLHGRLRGEGDQSPLEQVAPTQAPPAQPPPAQAPPAQPPPAQPPPAGRP